jgi:DNA-binding CsgD family transcriptional regulator
MDGELRKTGIGVIGDMPWGTHFCYFYETKRDLLHTLIPYFKAGLENNEFCLWIISQSESLTVVEAKAGLRQAVPDLDRHLAQGRIEILNHHEWFSQGGAFDLHKVINQFGEKLDRAKARGYEGMRVNGSTAWVLKKDGREFREFEGELDQLISNQPIIVLCTFPLVASGAQDILDAARTHQFAIALRHGNWEVVETPGLGEAREEKKQRKLKSAAASSLELLTARQRDVLRLLAEGHTMKEVALILDISVKTVESHRTNLMDRLDIHDVPSLVRYAIKTGLIELEQVTSPRHG